MSSLNHPYYPLGVEVPGFAPNTTPLPVILGIFGILILGAVLSPLWWAKHTNPQLRAWDGFCICWFAQSGFLHCIFEGYLVLNQTTIAGSQHIFAQLWKEYALSDSRYVTADPFVMWIETATVLIWGPLCWAVVFSIARGGRLRHPLQMAVCIGHFYGVILYYGTCYMEEYRRGISYSRPDFLYGWVYFVGMNAPWAFVPPGKSNDTDALVDLTLPVDQVYL